MTWNDKLEERVRLRLRHLCRFMSELKTTDGIVDYDTFLKVLNRPDGWKPAGTAGTSDSTALSGCRG